MVGFFIVALTTILAMGIGYVVSSRTVGRKAAQRRLSRFALLIPLGLLLALGLNSLGKYSEYGRISFNFLFAAYLGLWLLTWNWRHRKAGALLLNVGRISVGKFIFWLGVFEVLVAVLNTSSAINKISTGLLSSTNLAEVISQLLFYWSLAIYFLSKGLSRLELRENGICYMFSVVKWEKLASYKWNESGPNVVTICFKLPRFLLSKGFFSVPIPSVYLDAVDRILAEHLIMAP